MQSRPFVYTPEDINKELNELWKAIRRRNSLPDQTGHAGEFLTTDGSATSWAVGGGVGNTIYTANDSLADSRFVDLDGNALQFLEGGNPFLSIDPTVNVENVRLQAHNTTGNDNVAYFLAEASDNGAGFNINADFNGGAENANIQSIAISGSSQIAYTADVHAFNAEGEVNLAVSLGQTSIRGFDSTGGGNHGIVQAEANAAIGEVSLEASFDNGAAQSSIELQATSGGSTIIHTADAHLFTISSGLRITDGGNDQLNIDTFSGSEVSSLSAVNTTGSGNVAGISGQTTDADATVLLGADFNGGANAATITIVANTTISTITHTAVLHQFLGEAYIFVGVQEFADNAAATGGGLTAGMIYRTGDLLKIVHT